MNVLPCTYSRAWYFTLHQPTTFYQNLIHGDPKLPYAEVSWALFPTDTKEKNTLAEFVAWLVEPLMSTN